MNRLQKQCIAASAGLHLLLLVALLFGSGFRSEQPDRLDVEPFHMMPSSVIESLLDDPADVLAEPETEPITETQAVENQEIQKQEPEPIEVEPKPEPKPDPKPVVEPKPEPKPEPTKEPSISKRVEKPKPKPKKTKIKISKVFKSNTTKRNPTVKTQGPKVTKTSANPLKINKNLGKVGGGSSIQGVTTVSGSLLGRYGHLVQSAYDRQWRQPAGISSSNLKVKVKVVVAKDGRIQSATISQSSGVSAMDQSIERAIRMVKRISQAPPEGASLSNRTFILNFNLKS
jgi:TonB family protein